MEKKRVSRMSWSALTVHTVLIVSFGLLLSTFTEAYMIIAFIVYAALTIALKTIIPKDLKKGMELVKAGKMREAISAFKASYEFFNNHLWLDKYRAVTMLSVSPMSYREMSLINIGFCYSQIQEAEKAKMIYEKVLDEFPKNQVALYALDMLKQADEK